MSHVGEMDAIADEDGSDASFIERAKSRDDSIFLPPPSGCTMNPITLVVPSVPSLLFAAPPLDARRDSRLRIRLKRRKSRYSSRRECRTVARLAALREGRNAASFALVKLFRPTTFTRCQGSPYLPFLSLIVLALRATSRRGCEGLRGVAFPWLPAAVSQNQK